MAQLLLLPPRDSLIPTVGQESGEETFKTHLPHHGLVVLFREHIREPAAEFLAIGSLVVFGLGANCLYVLSSDPNNVFAKSAVSTIPVVNYMS
jgi:hypothetical protein